MRKLNILPLSLLNLPYRVRLSIIGLSFLISLSLFLVHLSAHAQRNCSYHPYTALGLDVQIPGSIYKSITIDTVCGMPQ